MADQEKSEPSSESETPFQRFERLAKKVVAAPKKKIREGKSEEHHLKS